MTLGRSTYDPAAQSRARRRRIANQTPAKTLHTSSYGGTVQAVQAKVAPKIERKVRQSIRDSARGEQCTVQLPGICDGDPEKTIWSHARWPWAGKGGATKAFCLNGCFACVACDSVFDGQRKPPPGVSRETVDLAWMRGHFVSLLRLAERGLV